MAYLCEFCNSTFKYNCNLITHQKSAKYCLESRIVPDKPLYECDVCYKGFVRKSVMQVHAKTCNSPFYMPQKIQTMLDQKDEEINAKDRELEAKDEEIEALKEEIKRLETSTKQVGKLKSELKTLKTKLPLVQAKADIYQEEYRAIRDKPTNVYNTTTNKLKLVKTETIDPFTVETVRNRLNDNQFTYGDFMSGLNGIKRFIIGIITKDDEKNYVTTDISRPHFHRLEDTKKWIGDKGALFLNKLFDEMKPAVQEHWDKFVAEMERARGYQDMDDFDADLDRVKPIACAIIAKQDSKCRKELLDDIIKYIKPRVAI